MSGFTQKYAIVCLFEPKQIGYEFAYTDWPLHVTLADTFAITWDVQKLVNALSDLAANTTTVQARAADDEYFGPDADIQVTIIEMHEQLIQLHYQIVALLKQAGGTFNDPQYSKKGYRAHGKVQNHARFHKGETLQFTNIALVDMYPDADPYQRKIIHLVELKNIQDS